MIRQLTLVAVPHTALHLSLAGFHILRKAKHHPRRRHSRFHRRLLRRRDRLLSTHIHHQTHGRPQRRLVGVHQLQQFQIRFANAVIPPTPRGAVATRHGLVVVSLVAHQSGIALVVVVAVGLAPLQQNVGIVQITGDVDQLPVLCCAGIVNGGVIGGASGAVVDVGPVAASSAGAAGNGRVARPLEAGQARIAVGIGIAISLRYITY